MDENNQTPKLNGTVVRMVLLLLALAAFVLAAGAPFCWTC